MNLPASNLNLQSLLGGAHLSQDGKGIVALSVQVGEGQPIEITEFSEILLSPEILSSFLEKLREILPEAVVRQIEAKLSSGKGLPDTAEFAALIEQIVAVVVGGNRGGGNDLTPGVISPDAPDQEMQLLDATDEGVAAPSNSEDAGGAQLEGEEIASELVAFIANLINAEKKPMVTVKATDGEEALPAGDNAGPGLASEAPPEGVPGLAVAEAAVAQALQSNQAPNPGRAETVLTDTADRLRRQLHRSAGEGLVSREAAVTPDAEEGEQVLSAARDKELPFNRQVLGMTVRDLVHERGNPVFSRLTAENISAVTVTSENNNGVGNIAKMNLDIPMGSVQRTAQAAPPPLGVPLGGKEWGEGLSNRISWMLGQNVQQATLRINPPHLGPIEIRVAVHNDQTNVMFSAQHSAVREAIESAIPRLREMFSENNMQLVNVDVGQREAGGQRAMSDFLFRGEGESLAGEEHLEDGRLEESASEETEPARLISEGLVDDYA